MDRVGIESKTTLFDFKSSGNSYSLIQENIFNIESFQNYSFSHTLHRRKTNELMLKLKSIKLTLLVLLALALISISTSLVACFIDTVAFNLIRYKKVLTREIEDPYLSCFVWVFISVVFITAATSFGYFFAPEADGSGIPEVKSIISGVDMPKYLTLKTLVCKIFGLICCSGALSIGKEGPHAHLAAIIATQMMRLKNFKKLKTHPGLKTLILEASVAAGVSAVMASPIGSVFFSIELTATYYMIPNIVFSLFCGAISSLVLSGFRLLQLTEMINLTEIPKGFNNIDLISFAVIGVIGGVVGVYFTILTKKLVGYRAQKRIPWLHKRFRYAWIITIAYSFTCFVMPFMMINAKQVLNQMLLTGDLPVAWSFFGDIGSLAMFFVLKMLFTSISTSVQIPGGVFLPVLVSGAAFGRIAHGAAAYLGGEASIAMYAAVSGAAFVASTCHCLSVSLMIFEMTGQIHYASPMLLSVVISYSIGSSIGLNIFDAIIVLKKILYLPAVRTTRLYKTKVDQIMDRGNSITLTSDLKDLHACISNQSAEKIVIVDESKFILADFKSENGRKYLLSTLDTMKNGISADQYQKLKNDINSNESIEKTPNSHPQAQYNFDPQNISILFWSIAVDFSSPYLKLDKSPISVQENTSLYKIHYMFLMLGLTQLYITKEFKLAGVVYRHYFTNPKKS